MTLRVLTSIVTGLLFAGLVGLSAARAAAQETPVPVAMQLQASATVGGGVCSALMALPMARTSGITTLTGVPRYVETGCAIGVDMKGDRPEILINLAASRAEGADLNAHLLKLAHVVGDQAGM